MGAPIPGDVTLNPRHRYELDAEYNARRGYLAHHWAVMRNIRVEPGNRRLDQLGRKGYETVEVMSPKDAAVYAGASLTALEIGQDRLREILAGVFNPELDAKLISYFLAPYAVLFWNIQGSGESNPSLRWHCDAGPSCHLKLLVYLNQTAGATELVDRTTTDLFKRLGYGFGPFAERVEDIASLGREHGIECAPDRLSPSPGSGVLFAPSEVLHRGVYPRDETRYVMQIGLIPWNSPWQQNLAETFATIAGNIGFGFPQMMDAPA